MAKHKNQKKERSHSETKALAEKHKREGTLPELPGIPPEGTVIAELNLATGEITPVAPMPVEQKVETAPEPAPVEQKAEAPAPEPVKVVAPAPAPAAPKVNVRSRTRELICQGFANAEIMEMLDAEGFKRKDGAPLPRHYCGWYRNELSREFRAGEKSALALLAAHGLSSVPTSAKPAPAPSPAPVAEPVKPTA